MVRPILTYACVVWWTALLKSTYLAELQKVQRLACLFITGALRSTPTKALEVFLNLAPLDIFCQGSAAKSGIRLQASGFWKSRPYGHANVLSLFDIDKVGITDYIIPSQNFDRNFKVSFPGRSEWEHGIPIPNSIPIYTDGSKMEHGVGSGVHSDFLEIDQSFKLPKNCSIFQAEIFAISEALSLIKSKDFRNKSFVICIDSQAAINALNSSTITSKLVSDCLTKLKSLANSCHITLCWVPGHSDVMGNEKADELARKGTELSNNSTSQTIGIPIQYIKATIDNKIQNILNKKWQDTTTCTISKQLWTSIDPKRTLLLLSFPKGTLRALVGVLTGHCYIGRYCARISGNPNTAAVCRSCNAIDSEESIFHLLCECPCLRTKRNTHMGQMFFDNLSELSSINLNLLCNFIRTTGWFNSR